MKREAEENESDLRLDDLILYCLEHWKSIAISMIIFAVVAGAFGCYRSMQLRGSAEESKAEKTKNAVMQLEDINSVKLAELDGVAHRIALYKQIIYGKELYLSQSVLMNLDSSNVVTELLQYKLSTVSGNVTNASQQQENLQLIVKSYESRLANDELYTAAGEYLGIDSAYVRELITASEYFPTVTNVYVSSGNDGDENITSNAILYVAIKGFDREYCDSIANYVKRRIEGIGEDLVNVTTPYTVTLMNTTVTTGVDNTIVTAKSDALNVIRTAETNITAVEKELSTAEVNYVEAKSEEDLEQLLDSMNIESEENEKDEESAESSTASVINKKFIVLGAFLGIFFAAAYWAVKYIFSTRLLYAYIFEDRYGLKTYSLKSKESELKGISGIFRRIRYRKTHFYEPDELARIFKAEIETLSEKREVTKVFIASSENFNGANDAFVNAMRAAMEGSGIEISSGEKISYDPDMIISISNADVLIIMENIAKSSKFEISEQMKFISEKNSQIIGAVIR